MGENRHPLNCPNVRKEHIVYNAYVQKTLCGVRRATEPSSTKIEMLDLTVCVPSRLFDVSSDVSSHPYIIRLADNANKPTMIHVAKMEKLTKKSEIVLLVFNLKY